MADKEKNKPAVADVQEDKVSGDNSFDPDLKVQEDTTGNTSPDEVEIEIIPRGSSGHEDEPVRAAEAPPPMRKLTRKQVLNRLLEKNEVILELSKRSTAQESELGELKNKWLRSVAEFENYRKRSRKEWELLKQQAKSEIILEMLVVVDDFERAFSVVEDSDTGEFIQGIKLIYNNLVQALEKQGIREIDSVNQPFDPHYHMALGQIDSKDVESGHIVEVIQKGYHLDDIVVRPANVIVAK